MDEKKENRWSAWLMKGDAPPESEEYRKKANEQLLFALVLIIGIPVGGAITILSGGLGLPLVLFGLWVAMDAIARDRP